MRVPAGYKLLPPGIRCRCIKLWQEGDNFYCYQCGDKPISTIPYVIDGKGWAEAAFDVPRRPR